MAGVDAEILEEPFLMMAQALEPDLFFPRGDQCGGNDSNPRVDELVGLREVDDDLRQRLLLQATGELPGAGAVELAGDPEQGGAAVHFSLQAAGRHRGLPFICASKA